MDGKIDRQIEVAFDREKKRRCRHARKQTRNMNNNPNITGLRTGWNGWRWYIYDK